VARLRRLARPVLSATAVLVAASACAGTDAASGPPQEELEQVRSVTNCGVEVEIDATPQRVVLLDTAPVTILDELGVLGTVVSRAGVFSPDYYDADLMTRIDEIPALSEDIDASGHLMLSHEVVIAQQPDLVLGMPEGLTREGLGDAGADVLVAPVFCAGRTDDASFEVLYDEVHQYGVVFDRNDRADDVVASLKDRVDAVERDQPGQGRTAAVLYPSVGGGPLYAYGRASMAQPQLDSAGLENVFSDVSERVFEVGVEELIARDPDVLVLLYQGDQDGVLEEVTHLPGAEVITAVRDDEILVQLFNFTEPSSPLTVTGLEQMAERFGQGSP
jgi:iron complex transport system substrate-binding protein